MIALFDALLIGLAVLIVVSMYLSHREREQSMEYAHATGYYAGLHDAAVAFSGERPSGRDRPWEDEDWYLKHCAGEADEIVEQAKAEQ